VGDARFERGNTRMAQRRMSDSISRLVELRAHSGALEQLFQRTALATTQRHHRRLRMRKVLTTSLIVSGALWFAVQAQAQTPASAPAAGGTADGTPFDIPYGTPIGLETAKKLIAAVEAEAAKHRWKMNIAVVDTHGDLVHFSRMDGAQLASINISQGKARTAARYRRESRAFYNAFETGHPYVATLDPTLIASPGGWPLIEGGKLIGAIGCSGGTGDQDAAACKAGADLVK
ncbi:MAG TPA: heme-binding protein, partial [Burkholderiaceae bacterium]|nr:heme-binding protein [Burkholderiaceae bacterium]